MQATIATLRPGGTGRSPLSNDAAYVSLLASSSSVELMGLLRGWEGSKYQKSIEFMEFRCPDDSRPRLPADLIGYRKP